MKKAVIIGASSEALHTMKKAKEYGIYLTALDGNEQAEGFRAADKALVIDISDEQAVLAAVKEERPDFVLTVPIGRYLTTIGAVNDTLKLPGIHRKAAMLCTDKYAFHNRLTDHGLRNCHCFAIAPDGQMDWEIQKLHFPAILKPRYGSGSRGIHMLMDESSWEMMKSEIRGEEYVLEECIPGEEYGVDGAVIRGEFYLVLLRKKENTPLPARQAVAYYSVCPEDPFYRQVSDYMKEITSCLGLSDCLFHADVIRTENTPFVIELSARPSGHNLHNLFTPLCTGVDVAEQFIRFQLGQSYCFEPAETKTMMIHYFDMQGTLNRIPDEQEVRKAAEEEDCRLVAYECHMNKGDVLLPVSDGHSLMGRGFFVLEGKQESTLKQGADHIRSLFLGVR